MSRFDFRISARHVARLFALTVAAGFPAAQVSAGTIDITPTPPDLNASVEPNIVLTFDDSGSMANQYMPDANSQTNGKRFYSSKWNLIYFEPDATKAPYDPPMNPDGTNFAAVASYTAAWRDGICTNRPTGGPTACGTSLTGTVNLSNNFGDRYGGNTNINTVSGQSAGGAFYTVFDATNASCDGTTGDNDCYDVVLMSGQSAAEQARFARWFSFYRNRNMMTRTSLTRVFGKLGGDIRVSWQTLNADINGLTTRAIEPIIKPSTWRTNLFHFLYSVGASGNTPNRAATIMASEFFKRPLTLDNMDPYWNGKVSPDARDLSCRQNFHMLVTDGYWNEPAIRPNPLTLIPAGFKDVQTNSTLGDPADPGANYSYARGAAVNPIVWNVPASPNTSSSSCTSDGSTNCYPSLADIGFHYWGTDLQPTLPNKVKAFTPDKSPNPFGLAVPPDPVQARFWNPNNDPATWQHVVQFMVAMGVAGQLNFPGDYVNLGKGTTAWPIPARNEARALDDTWHAAINSRGEYFSASNPQELINQITTIIDNIVSRAGTSSGLSTSSNLLDTSGIAGYSAGFDSSSWSGFVVKQTLTAAGAISTVDWDAGCLLTGGPCAKLGNAIVPGVSPDSRRIFTSSGTAGSGTPFRWSGGITTPQQTALHLNPTSGLNDAQGQARLNYIRGVRTDETSALAFRKRTSVLGAVINSQPTYVAGPTGGYQDVFPEGTREFIAAQTSVNNTFEKFVSDNLNRTPLVYVGANDGMMHAFNAQSGVEEWAYVPSMLFGNGKLSKSTQDAVGLVPSVDDQPIVQDVFINGAWKSILVGSMRFGARGIYALDVTNPSSASEGAAAGRIMWEFSKDSPGGADLGYTFASANIARIHFNEGGADVGKWVVLVSSGYFPKTGPDSTVPGAIANTTALYVLDAASGALLRKISTPAGVTSFGLSTPGVVDYGVDQVDDVAFVGDVAGNLFRFDLSTGDPATWSVSHAFATYATSADVGKQPITVMPVAFPNPEGTGLTIVFGTGKYLGNEDRTASGTPQQAFYGIPDVGTGITYPVPKTALLAQTLTQVGLDRLLTDNPIVGTGFKGWTIPLTTLGERNVVTLTPLYSVGRAILVTLIPQGDDPCEPSRKGSIFVVDATTGGANPQFTATSGGNPARSTGPHVVGREVANPPITGTLGVVSRIGGVSIVVPGSEDFTGATLGGQSVWRRGSWREMLDFKQ